MENVTLPEKVNLIISEWMGTLLIFEYMIESVLVARDRWLAPGGVVWPSSATLFVAPVRALEEYDRTVLCWRSRYGFDMSRVAPLAKDEFLTKPKYVCTLVPAGPPALTLQPYPSWAPSTITLQL
jgi:protein arginine N-methyltransferase 2